MKWHFQVFLVFFFFQKEYSHHKHDLARTNNIYKLCSSHYFLALLYSSQILNFFFHFLTASPNLALELVMGNPLYHLPLSKIDFEILWLMNKLDKTPV